jgi:hypothetical protein
MKPPPQGIFGDAANDHQAQPNPQTITTPDGPCAAPVLTALASAAEMGGSNSSPTTVPAPCRRCRGRDSARWRRLSRPLRLAPLRGGGKTTLPLRGPHRRPSGARRREDPDARIPRAEEAHPDQQPPRYRSRRSRSDRCSCAQPGDPQGARPRDPPPVCEEHDRRRPRGVHNRRPQRHPGGLVTITGDSGGGLAVSLANLQVVRAGSDRCLAADAHSLLEQGPRRAGRAIGDTGRDEAAPQRHDRRHRAGWAHEHRRLIAASRRPPHPRVRNSADPQRALPDLRRPRSPGPRGDRERSRGGGAGGRSS